MALFAYLDESGKFHDGTGFICLCGYLSWAEEWEDFSPLWRDLLLKHEFQRIHLTEFYSQCALRRWEKPKADGVLGEFVEAIRSSHLIQFAVGVDGRYFKAKHEIAGRKDADPALFAIECLMRDIRNACDELGKTPQILLTFDEDEEYAVRAYKLVSRLRKNYAEVKKMIVSIGFADDVALAPLQAADILAGLTNQYWRDSLDIESPDPPEMLRRLLTPPEEGGLFVWQGKFWNRAMIDKNWDDLGRARSALASRH